MITTWRGEGRWRQRARTRHPLASWGGPGPTLHEALQFPARRDKVPLPQRLADLSRRLTSMRSGLARPAGWGGGM